MAKYTGVSWKKDKRKWQTVIGQNRTRSAGRCVPPPPIKMLAKVGVNEIVKYLGSLRISAYFFDKLPWISEVLKK